MNKHNLTTATISGIPVHCSTFSQILRRIEDVISQREQGNYICITNTESMYHALRIPAHMGYITKADLSLCDGIGSVIAGYFWGHKVPRLNGPVFMLEACEYGISRGWKHFFYGGKEGVADLMAEKLRRKFPGLEVCGTFCPPFRPLTPEEDEKVIRQINDAKADIVWVGLGLLKQEKWIADHLGEINASWMSGVGAAFDYHAGAVKWAPPWIQKIGMEWLYRTILQPRLRIKRYYWSFIFLFESIGMAVGTKFRRKKGIENG